MLPGSRTPTTIRKNAMTHNALLDDTTRLDSEIFKIHADFCSVLANEKRLRIMWMLQEGEYPVGAIAERKEGQQVFYRITSEKFMAGCRLIREGIMETLRSRSEVFDDA